MADFCKQCSEELFDKDHRELAALHDKELYTDDVGATALCEGCGFIVVDYDGRCIAQSCEKHGCMT